MKRYFFLMLLISLPAAAVSIPLDAFDQSKLEGLLRNIPASVSALENHGLFQRKKHIFPKTESRFSIKCLSDYYEKATIPSVKQCSVNIDPHLTLKGDEHHLRLTDKTSVAALFAAISYGQEVKNFYSTERVYGLGADGKHRKLFRYSISCQQQYCDLTFVSKVTPLVEGE
jgi:hypothetical protein